MAKQLHRRPAQARPEITAVTNQWVNSYKRLVPGYEAPVYISWAQRNRSDLIRVPMYKPGKEKATRIEFRSPDPACNPYLAFAVMLAAGLEGIERKTGLPEPVRGGHLRDEPAERRAEAGHHRPCPEASRKPEETEKSVLANEVLGDHIFSKFIENKKMEWDRLPDLRDRLRDQPLPAHAVKPERGNLSGCPFFYKSIGKRSVLSYKDTAGVPRSGHPHTLV